MWIRNYDEAISSFKKAIDLDANFGPAYPLMAFAYFCNGKVAEAVALAEKFAAMFPPHAGSFFLKCFMYAEAGRRADAVRMVEDLKEFGKTSYVSPAILGLSYYSIGEVEIARKLLLDALEERSNVFLHIHLLPIHRFHGDPIYQDIIRKVGLP